jgi:dGTPase
LAIIDFNSPLLKFNGEFKSPAKTFLDALIDLTVKHIIKIQPVQTLEYRGRFIVMCIFEAIASNPSKLLNKSFARQYEAAADENEKMRVVCDYVAGMTDSYATRVYQRLFIPGQGTIFEKL